MRMRVILVMAAAATLIGLGAAAWFNRGTSPALDIDESVAADFAAVARDDWNRFVAAFPAMEDCIGRVTLVADYSLDDRARYDPATRIMAVRVPGPKVLLDRAVIHELAHHLEVSCLSQVEMRPPFLAALGRNATDDWYEGSDWGRIPSEVFAEAVVEYVLEERGRAHTGLGLINPSAVDIVVDWAAGR